MKCFVDAKLLSYLQTCIITKQKINEVGLQTQVPVLFANNTTATTSSQLDNRSLETVTWFDESATALAWEGQNLAQTT